jgi:hypothetical protein
MSLEMNRSRAGLFRFCISAGAARAATGTVAAALRWHDACSPSLQRRVPARAAWLRLAAADA